MTDMMVAVRTVLSKYVTFSGRASRAEFWWWFLAVLLLSLVVGLIDGTVLAPLLGFGAFDENAGQPPVDDRVSSASLTRHLGGSSAAA